MIGFRLNYDREVPEVVVYVPHSSIVGRGIDYKIVKDPVGFQVTLEKTYDHTTAEPLFLEVIRKLQSLYGVEATSNLRLSSVKKDERWVPAETSSKIRDAYKKVNRSPLEVLG